MANHNTLNIKTPRLNIGLLYLSLHNQLKKKYGFHREFTKKDLFCILGKHYLVPKNTRIAVIKEMELMKLIEVTDDKRFKVLNCDLDIERDVQKFYKTLELF